ncbi:hypothetical protein EZS27_012333 [termite gut metagenome]|jgi:hypothetical protein|uniref:Uncharacterized protein n=1 Tax=termite gut metagenome TaxID=433724 RepID=A0A5J4S2K4_9ZZZZ
MDCKQLNERVSKQVELMGHEHTIRRYETMSNELKRIMNQLSLRDSSLLSDVAVIVNDIIESLKGSQKD